MKNEIQQHCPFISIELDTDLTISSISQIPMEYQQSDFVGKPYTSFLAPKDSKVFKDKSLESLQSNQAQTFCYMAPADNFEMHLFQAHLQLSQDKKTFLLSLLDIQDNPKDTQPTLKEELELKNKTLQARIDDLETEFELQQRNYDIFVEQAPIAMYDIDLESRILTGNEKALELFHLKGTFEFKTHFIFEFVHEKDREALEEKFTLATLGTEQYFTFTSPNETFQIFKSCFIPVYDFQNTIYKVFSLTQDITKEYLAEEILRKQNSTLQNEIEQKNAENEKKDQLIFDQTRHVQMAQLIKMIAHQWRQPLSLISTISGNVEIMLDLGNTDKSSLKSSMKTINKEAQKLSQIITDFKDFYKPKKQKTDLLLKDLGDSVMQVMINLIENSHDILLERKIKNPEITLRGYETEDFQFIEISDNGEGIKEDILGEIFDPYFSTKVDKNGTGLGLHMAKTMIESHCDGILSVENIKHGARFTIKLPNV